jgi:hypothetical protein
VRECVIGFMGLQVCESVLLGLWVCKFVRVCVIGFMGLQVCERVCYWVCKFVRVCYWVYGFLLVTTRSVSKIAAVPLLSQVQHPSLYLYYADSRMTQVITLLYIPCMREGSELVCTSFFHSFISALLLHIFRYSPCQVMCCVNTYRSVLDCIIQ